MLRHVVLALLALCAPVLVVLAGLVAAGFLAWSWAILAVLLVAAIQLPLLIGHFHHLRTILAYLGKLRRGGGAAIGMVQHWEGGATLLTPELDVALKQTARERERQQQAVESAMAANEAILSNLPDPLLLLDGKRRILRANPAAEALLGGELAGRDLVSVLRQPDLLSAVDQALAGQRAEAVDFDLPGPVEQHLIAHVVGLEMPAVEGPAAVVALHDLTAIHRAERMRADFVANASHELRTPLASLLGFVETLRGPARDDPAALQSFLPIMHEQAQRMTRLVEDLLSLSRIELREHSPPSGRVDLARTLDAVARGLALRAKDRGMRLDLDLAGCPAVLGEEDELTQVFQNLIDNAIKYGRDDSVVRVLRRLGDAEEDAFARRLGVPCLAVAVHDEGEGIPREHLSRLTERFYRVDTARSRKLGGTGLGLAIVKHIVNRHRGLLRIESIAGEGSVFTVYLPLAPAAEMHGEDKSDTRQKTLTQTQ